MKSNKIMQTVANIGKKSAVVNTEMWCRMFLHQPKVPAKLLEMKKSK